MNRWRNRLTVLGAVLATLLGATILNAGSKLGQPLTLDSPTPMAEILADPDTYVGNTVQIKGKVSAVCETAGCWMTLVDPKSGKSMRIKVNDGEIVFPVEAIGKVAVAEGKFEKLDMTKEQVIAWKKHEAEENGKPFDASSVAGPMTLYQVRGTGAVVLD